MKRIVDEVCRKLDGETPLERYTRRRKEEYHPLQRKYITELNKLEADMAQELKEAQVHCNHKLNDIEECTKCGAGLYED